MIHLFPMAFLSRIIAARAITVHNRKPKMSICAKKNFRDIANVFNFQKRTPGAQECQFDAKILDQHLKLPKLEFIVRCVEDSNYE